MAPKAYASVRSPIVIFIHRLIGLERLLRAVRNLDMLMIGMHRWIIQSQMEGQLDQSIQTMKTNISKYTEDF